MKTRLIQRILCAIDFSEPSQAAFRFADQLALEVGANLVLVHAFNKPEALTMAGQTHPSDPRLKERLDAFTPSSPTVEVKRVLHAGPPGEVICWVAQEEQCNLIVLGPHGGSPLMDLLLGSVAEYVLRHAPCPVVAVRTVPANAPRLEEPRVLPLPPPRFM